MIIKISTDEDGSRGEPRIYPKSHGQQGTDWKWFIYTQPLELPGIFLQQGCFTNRLKYEFSLCISDSGGGVKFYLIGEAMLRFFGFSQTSEERK